MNICIILNMNIYNHKYKGTFTQNAFLRWKCETQGRKRGKKNVCYFKKLNFQHKCRVFRTVRHSWDDATDTRRELDGQTRPSSAACLHRKRNAMETRERRVTLYLAWKHPDAHQCQSWALAQLLLPQSRRRCLLRCTRRWRVCRTAWSRTACGCTACGAAWVHADAARCRSCTRWTTGGRCFSWSESTERKVIRSVSRSARSPGVFTSTLLHTHSLPPHTHSDCNQVTACVSVKDISCNGVLIYPVYVLYLFSLFLSLALCCFVFQALSCIFLCNCSSFRDCFSIIVIYSLIKLSK